jgi:SPP1 gp7 family putative phage head morphogenesis protein
MQTDFAPAPHEEAAALIANKPVVAREVFDGLLPELRGRAFTITGVEAANVQQAVRDRIAELPRGAKWDDVKADIADAIEPFIGDGADRRAELLLRTHGFQAFQSSNWRVIQEDADSTHIQYLATEDDRVRATHIALNGIILPKEDPFWQRHFPPWEWGCRCRTRPINPDLLDEAKIEDSRRAPDDHMVLEGPALRKLNEGTLQRNGQTYDVLPPEGDHAFTWHPDNLRLPLAELEKRYDPEVWDAFVAKAKATQLAEDQSVWDWLTKKKKKGAK